MVRRDPPSSDPPGNDTPLEIDVKGLRFALVVARFHSDLTDELLAGAVDCLAEHDIPAGRVDVFPVPGAWELPQAAARIVELGRHDALIALGCVIRGETPHFDFISAEATRGLGEVGRGSSTPVAFGLLTTDTVEQARARALRSEQDKGREAARAALEMLALYRRIGVRS